MVKDARSINPFGLRMPPELRGQLEAFAQANGVSLNTEIIRRLAESIEGQSGIEQRVAMLEKIVLATPKAGRSAAARRRKR